jgi:hypothetical protein
MSSNLGLKVLAGAVALALAGVASANTTAAGNTVGTVFLNVVDTSNNTSFFFDTGQTFTSFNSNQAYTFNVASDANYQAFVAGQGATDILDYSVISGYKPTSSPSTVLFTATTAPAPVVGSKVNAAETQVETFLPAVNQVVTTSTTSAFVNQGATGAAGWATSGNEITLNGDLKVTDNSTLGTAIAFYKEVTNSPGSQIIKGTVTTLAGMWDFTQAGALTYSVAALPTPIPTPLLLLLSGLGLMGVIARRGKSASSEPMFNAAAA